MLSILIDFRGPPLGLRPIWTCGLFGPNDLCLGRRRIFFPGYKFLPGRLDTFARILPGYNPPVRLFAFLICISFHWAALTVTLSIFYQMFIWETRKHGWFLVWWFHWYWTTGIPYLLLVVLFKWVVIGRFKEGPSTPCLDYKRFVLQMLLQSRFVIDTITFGASSHFIMTFYRLMGAKIGWNAQVMPFTLLEFDLVSIGDCVAFGGLASFFPRDREGNMRSIKVGDYAGVFMRLGCEDFLGCDILLDGPNILTLDVGLRPVCVLCFEGRFFVVHILVNVLVNIMVTSWSRVLVTCILTGMQTICMCTVYI